MNIFKKHEKIKITQAEQLFLSRKEKDVVILSEQLFEEDEFFLNYKTELEPYLKNNGSNPKNIDLTSILKPGYKIYFFKQYWSRRIGGHSLENHSKIIKDYDEGKIKGWRCKTLTDGSGYNFSYYNFDKLIDEPIFDFFSWKIAHLYK